MGSILINMSSSDTTLARGLTGTKLIGAHKDKRVRKNPCQCSELSPLRPGDVKKCKKSLPCDLSEFCFSHPKPQISAMCRGCLGRPAEGGSKTFQREGDRPSTSPSLLPLLTSLGLFYNTKLGFYLHVITKRGRSIGQRFYFA